MGSYWTYYALWLFLAYATQNPWFCGLILLFFLLRPVLPDPHVMLRSLGQIGRLKAQAIANPANSVARRDLARLYLELRRPKAALRWLDEARQRHPDDAELLYLTGLARLRSNDAAGAIEAVVRAVELDPRVAFGEPYRVAAEALVSLGRVEEAEDALMRYVDANTSSIEAMTKLARVRRQKGDVLGAREALNEAVSTWSQIPGYKRRKEALWFFWAYLSKLFT